MLQLNVWAAFYGPKDVTELILNKIQNNAIFFTITAGLCGDPWPGVKKILSIFYSYGAGAVFTDVYNENEIVNITFHPSIHSQMQISPMPGMLNIIGAVYGFKDIKLPLAHLVMKGLTQISANNQMFGDGFPGVKNILSVLYLNKAGTIVRKCVQESQVISF